MDGIVGSIHKVSAFYLKKESYNGWNFWYVKRQNSYVSIDQLRYEYVKKYLSQGSDNYTNKLDFENTNVVNNNEEDLLNYGNNELSGV